MNKLNSRRPALFGCSRAVLTLGLMMARRDLRLQGICPDMSDVMSDEMSERMSEYPDTARETAIPEAESRALHGTLLLGCPVYVSAAELLRRSDLIVADPDMSKRLTGLTDMPVVTVSEGAAEAENIPVPEEFAVSVSRNGERRFLRFSCPDAGALSDMRRLWDYLQPSGAWDGDAGLLNWEQAGALAERLFAANLTA